MKLALKLLVIAITVITAIAKAAIGNGAQLAADCTGATEWLGTFLILI